MPEEAREEAAPEAASDEPADLDALRARLREEQEKAQQHLESWQRAAADYQNLKRRIEEERSEVGRIASASLVINLLPLVDDIERALGTVDVKLAGLTWLDGIRLIYHKFLAVLENAGVKEIEADGLAFDPNVHEAIGEAPGEEGKVLSVVQKGYTLGDRVVRPAMVIVGSGTRDAGDGTRDAGQRDTQEDTT